MANSGFMRTTPPTSVQPCPNLCRLARESGDTLSRAVAARIEALTGHREVQTGRLQIDNQPATVSGGSKCQQQARALGPTLRRFNRYRAALPYARAAEDMNQLSDENDAPAKRKDRAKKCLTMLPESADELCAALGLPPGTIKQKQLVDNHSGFRAAMYRDEATGTLILVARDTQPHSLVDWKTNTDNGQGLDTDQYAAMRLLSGRLAQHNVKFDVAGYSKGGGLAQEAGLLSKNSEIYVFNSAGLHEASLTRTATDSFDSLRSRTKAFSSEGDFLTYMNETTDPEQQITNARFLRTELAGEAAEWTRSK